MPRRARHYIAHQPYHIVQRGNNREACFIELENYQFYLELWKELSKKFGVYVHAYCLMTNHVHFLVTPEVALAAYLAGKAVTISTNDGSCQGGEEKVVYIKVLP